MSNAKVRDAKISRHTNETDITLQIVLDGTGVVEINTGIGFFDHMLTLFFRHALIDAKIFAKGDIEVDGHHTIEDIGICLGQALTQALDDKSGIQRYGFMILPMEEALARVVLDLSGRPHLEYRVELTTQKVGEFDTCLVREFLRAFCVNGGVNLHVDLLAGSDPHHCIEAIFKGLGRAIKIAVAIDSRESGIPSSKGVL